MKYRSCFSAGGGWSVCACLLTSCCGLSRDGGGKRPMGGSVPGLPCSSVSSSLVRLCLTITEVRVHTLGKETGMTSEGSPYPPSAQWHLLVQVLCTALGSYKRKMSVCDGKETLNLSNLRVKDKEQSEHVRDQLKKQTLICEKQKKTTEWKLNHKSQ